MGTIYKLEAVHSNELLYIGMTFQVPFLKRVQVHEKKLREHSFDGAVKISYMEVSDRDTADLEKWLIMANAPLWNVRDNTGIGNVFLLNPNFKIPEWQEWEHGFENFRYLGEKIKPPPRPKRKAKGRVTPNLEPYDPTNLHPDYDPDTPTEITTLPKSYRPNGSEV